MNIIKEHITNLLLLLIIILFVTILIHSRYCESERTTSMNQAKMKVACENHYGIYAYSIKHLNVTCNNGKIIEYTTVSNPKVFKVLNQIENN